MNDASKNRLKLITVVVLTAFSFTLYALLYHVWKEDVSFRFTYFLPALLACLWWGRRGIILLLLMAVVFFFLVLFSPVDIRVWDDVVGSLVIIVTILVVAELSERRNRLIGSLEERIEERTRKLSQRNRELEAYGHTISHDLLGPLTIIKGYAGVGRERLPEDAGRVVRESLDKISETADRMRELTTSLLEYALAGQAEGNVERVEPSRVLREALQEASGLIQDEGGRVLISSDLPAILVDPLKLRQVFSNLLGNAIKYRDEQRPIILEIGYVGGGEIEHEYAPGSETVTFFVRDNGRGIEADALDEIFLPFKRASRDRSPGAGIGLATVQRAVEGWGGKVWAESIPGKGSTFYFTATAVDSGLRPTGPSGG